MRSLGDWRTVQEISVAAESDFHPGASIFERGLGRGGDDAAQPKGVRLWGLLPSKPCSMEWF